MENRINLNLPSNLKPLMTETDVNTAIDILTNLPNVPEKSLSLLSPVSREIIRELVLKIKKVKVEFPRHLDAQVDKLFSSTANRKAFALAKYDRKELPHNGNLFDFVQLKVLLCSHRMYEKTTESTQRDFFNFWCQYYVDYVFGVLKANDEIKETIKVLAAGCLPFERIASCAWLYRDKNSFQDGLELLEELFADVGWTSLPPKTKHNLRKGLSEDDSNLICNMWKKQRGLKV